MRTTYQNSRYRQLNQRGMSLVELMVAMVIGLVISLAIFSVLNTFESRKRITTSVNDIDQAGNYAIYAIDKWVRSAGSGFTQGDGSTFGCKLTAANAGTQVLPRTAALPAPFASVSSGTANVFKLIPLLILPGQTTPNISGNTSDVLLVMAGTSGSGQTSTAFLATPSTSQINVVNTKGFTANDLVLVTDLSSAATGTPCMIEQVASGFTGGATTALTLPTATANYYQATINSVALASAYIYSANNDQHQVFNLGNVSGGNPPVFLVLGVGDNNTLFGFDLLQNQNPTLSGAQAAFTVADSVFEMHALYGLDTDDDGSIDTWQGATGSYTPANLTAGTASALTAIKRIKAIRIGLILRTALPTPEKAIVTAGPLTLFSDLATALNFSRTLSAPTTAESSSTAASGCRTIGSGNPAEQCYRYRTIEATIPLRNLMMVSTAAS